MCRSALQEGKPVKVSLEVIELNSRPIEYLFLTALTSWLLHICTLAAANNQPPHERPTVYVKWLQRCWRAALRSHARLLRLCNTGASAPCAATRGPLSVRDGTSRCPGTRASCWTAPRMTMTLSARQPARCAALSYR